jgi:hypothetical protein
MVERTTRRVAEIDGTENVFEFDHRALHSGEPPATGHEVSQIELSMVLKVRLALPH